MFKFNFSLPDNEGERGDIHTTDSKENAVETENIKKEEGRIMEITSLHHEKVVQYQQDTTAIFSFRNFSLVNVQYLEETLSDSNSSESFKNLTTAIQMNSDVIKGVYEGIGLLHMQSVK